MDTVIGQAVGGATDGSAGNLRNSGEPHPFPGRDIPEERGLRHRVMTRSAPACQSAAYRHPVGAP